MATYKYSAVDRSGKPIKATIDADTQELAMTELRNKGYTISSIAQASLLERDISIGFLEKKPKPRDRSVFCRQFVSIINAGVPVVQALDMLSTQTENKVLARSLHRCKQEIEKGETLATAMAQEKKSFNQLFVTMAEAGEASGSLDSAFTRMAIQEEKDAKLHATIKKALTYPIVVLIVAIGVVIGMLAFVFPRFETMFDAIGTGSLPGLTLGVMAASEFIINKWYILLAIVLVLVFGIRYFKQTEPGRLFFGKVGMKLPVFGKLIVKNACSKMARTLNSLTAAGVSLIDALEITSKTMTNIYFERALLAAKDDVSMGTTLSESLERSGVFPPLVYQMISIGEEAGSLDEMLTKLADYYEEEVDEATAQVMALIEPMIIILLALLVGTIVLACLMPMMSLYEALDSM